MPKLKDSKPTCQAAFPCPAVTAARAGAGVSGRGGQAGITCPPQIVKNLKCVHSGIDTLHLSVYADFHASDILHEAEKARDVAREFEQDKVPFTYFSPQWNVHRTGRRFYPFHISQGDIHIFMNRHSVSGSMPTCLIEIGSMSCHHPGAFSVYDDIVSYFHSCNVAVRKHHIKRVDLSSDFVGLDFQDFDLWNMHKIVSRAVKRSVHFSGALYSGISVGKGDLMSRVYDKQKELIEKRATAKADFFHRLWGLVVGDTDTPVTRVEFQYRREALVEFSFDDYPRIETLEDLKKCLNGLWSYSSRVWLRHSRDVVDRKNRNQTRTPVSDFWQLVQNVDFNNENKNLWRVRKNNNYENVQALIDQGVGCLVSAMACTLKDISDFKQIAQKASTTVWRNIRSKIRKDEDAFLERVSIVFNASRLDLIPST